MDKPSLLREAMVTAMAALGDKTTRATFEKIFHPGENALSEMGSNDASLTLRYIISALMATTKEDADFEGILSRFLMLGGEGLSAHCCVLGGILGAYFGYSNIPERWLHQLPKENIAWLNAKMNHLLDLFGLP